MQHTGKSFMQHIGKSFMQYTGKSFIQHIGKSFMQYTGKSFIQHTGKYVAVPVCQCSFHIPTFTPNAAQHSLCVYAYTWQLFLFSTSWGTHIHHFQCSNFPRFRTVSRLSILSDSACLGQFQGHPNENVKMASKSSNLVKAKISCMSLILLKSRLLQCQQMVETDFFLMKCNCICQI